MLFSPRGLSPLFCSYYHRDYSYRKVQRISQPAFNPNDTPRYRITLLCVPGGVGSGVESRPFSRPDGSSFPLLRVAWQVGASDPTANLSQPSDAVWPNTYSAFRALNPTSGMVPRAPTALPSETVSPAANRAGSEFSNGPGCFKPRDPVSSAIPHPDSNRRPACGPLPVEPAIPDLDWPFTTSPRSSTRFARQVRFGPPLSR